MHFWFLAVFAVLCNFVVLGVTATNPPTPTQTIRVQARHDENLKVTNVTMDEEAARHLFRQWQDQAVSGLMAAVASKKIGKVSDDDAKRHELCAKHADTVVKHAQCVSRLLRLPNQKRSRHEFLKDRKKLLRNLKPIKIHQPAKSLDKSIPRLRRKFKTAEVLKFADFETKTKSKKKLRRCQNCGKNSDNAKSRRREKRYIRTNADHYSLRSVHDELTPIGEVARNLLKTVLIAKKKSKKVRWQTSIARAHAAAARRKELRRRVREYSPDDPLEELAFRGLERGGISKGELFDLLSDGKPNRARLRQLEGASRDPSKRFLALIREGMKLGFMATGQNTTAFDDKTLKLMSPRFLSVTAAEESDDEAPIEVLSPSVFSLHNNGSDAERALSLPKLVKNFSSADQQMLLDLVFEAADVESAVERALDELSPSNFQKNRKKRYETEMRNAQGEPLYFTKEKAVKVLGSAEEERLAVHEKLIQSYSPTQLREMNETGYAVLDHTQLMLLYGRGSPHENASILETYQNKSAPEIHQQIRAEIHALAEMEPFQRRQNDIVLSPIVAGHILFTPLINNPVILTPIIFTGVIGSPAVLGPVIIGPWMFLPLILSPRVLSPLIIAPMMFVPVVLSPLVLHPAILCPGIFNPIILSPAVLSPFILSPQVFTPMILTPLVMSPFIASPSVGVPLILSPSVLNPIVYSPLALTAIVLSPNALSPLVESKVALAELILSPSLLS